MRIRCKQCGVDMQVPPRTEGKKLRCPECGCEFICELPEAIIVEERPEVPAPLRPDEILLVDEIGTYDLADQPAEAEADQQEDPLAAIAAEIPSADEALADMSTNTGADYVVKDNPRQWHVMVAGVAAVALTWQELKDRAAAGEIKPRTRLWYAPKDLTVMARDLPGLLSPAKPTPAAPSEETPAVVPAENAQANDAEEAAALADALGSLGSAAEQTPDATDVLAEEADQEDDAPSA